MECLFCSIVAGKIPTLKVSEDSLNFAFLDINPSSPGHTVIIPKKHYSKLEEMPKAEVEAMFGFVSELSKCVMKAVGTENCNIGINNGKIAGQEIPHVHVHILPRFPSDGGGSIQHLVKMPSNKEDLPKVLELIKGTLGGAPSSPLTAQGTGPENKKEPEKKVESSPQPKAEVSSAKPKPRIFKSLERDLQEFNLKEQDNVLDLTEAKNI